MHRFGYVWLSLLFVLSFYEGAARARQKDKRPNIVYIMSDDHGYQAISAYGYGLNSTPNIDRLAKEGAIFTNACVTNSLCAPSRAVLLTANTVSSTARSITYMLLTGTRIIFASNCRKQVIKPR